MSDPTANTELPDDTIPADAGEPAPRASMPRIRPARPSASPPPGGTDYLELPIVDPGHYVISREIARGGMGLVQIARDRRLGRDVALKEVLTDRDTARRRFEREARITARLQHPSIVGIHEAGVWPSGEPFYAMPLLTGRSLDEAITAAATFAGRLGLLPNVLAIADAMAYAHGRRVIHRDLKPRNVIVGEFGETVVIDWGLAKELDVVDATTSSDTDEPRAAARPPASGAPAARSGGSTETTVGDVLGTPAYMPPEQAAGGSVDERADVYAIGAILYQLLTGAPPFTADTKTRVLAAVSDTPPRAIREIVPGAPRELVAIVERAMARDREARYRTARELAEDLRAFLTGKLVGAHRYSRAQRLRRWVVRHRTLVTAIGAALVVALVIGGVAANRLVAAYRLVGAQRSLALANQRSAEDLLRYMLGDLRAQLARMGRLEVLEGVARRAAAYYDARGAATSDEDLQLAGVAREAIGNVLQDRNDLAAARAEFEKARAAADELAARHPGDVEISARRALAWFRLARAVIAQGDLQGALAITRPALASVELLAAGRPTHPELARAIHTGHHQHAGILEDIGDIPGALAAYQRALDAAVAEVALTGTPEANRRVLTIHSSRGRILRKYHHDYPGALAAYRRGLAIGEQLLAREPAVPKWLVDVGVSHNQIGELLLDLDDRAGAALELQIGTAQLERATARDPDNAEWRGKLAGAHEKLGMVLFAAKDHAGALAAYRKFHAMSVELAERDPTNLDEKRGVSLALNKLGDAQLALADLPAALASYREALVIREALVAKDPSNGQWRRDRFYSHYKLAEAHLAHAHHADAIAELRTALVLAEGNVALQPSNGSFQSDAVGTHDALGDVYAQVGDRAAARAAYEAALALTRQYAPRGDRKDWDQSAAKIAAKLAKLPRP